MITSKYLQIDTQFDLSSAELTVRWTKHDEKGAKVLTEG